LPLPPAAGEDMAADELAIAEEQVEAEAEGAGSRSNWSGSDADTQDIIWLNRSHRITPGTISRPPGKEIFPITQPGERVVFLSHFKRGFGLPLSDFASDFFDHFDLQPHHLTANAIMTLSCFVTFYEAYLGLWPTLELFKRFFLFQRQTILNPTVPASEKQMTEIGACTILPRPNSIFPKIMCLESAKGWHKTFFYIKSGAGEADMLRLPTFVMAPPTAMTNWRSHSKNPSAEVQKVERRLEGLNTLGLSADDLVATFISRRVSPLQKRPHKMCQMSGPFDPCRHST
jgi:hypothetical protein